MTEESKTLGFRIKDLKVISAALDTRLLGKAGPEDVRFAVKTFVSGNRDDKTLDIYIHIRAFVFGSAPEKAFAFLETRTSFDIEDFDKRVSNNEALSIPDEVVEIFMGMSFSTARGILWQRGLGTVLENAILPHMDMGQISKLAVAANHKQKEKQRQGHSASAQQVTEKQTPKRGKAHAGKRK